MNIIGKVIYTLRTNCKMTQEELSHGICAVSTLSRIENGEQVPGKASFDALIRRLGRDPSEYYNILYGAEDFEAAGLMHEINAALNGMELDRAAELIKQAEGKDSFNENLGKQFLLSSKANLATRPALPALKRKSRRLRSRITISGYARNGGF